MLFRGEPSQNLIILFLPEKPISHTFNVAGDSPCTGVITVVIPGDIMFDGMT